MNHGTAAFFIQDKEGSATEKCHNRHKCYVRLGRGMKNVLVTEFLKGDLFKI